MSWISINLSSSLGRDKYDNSTDVWQLPIFILFFWPFDHWNWNHAYTGTASYLIPKLLEKLVWSKAKLILVRRKTLSLRANLFRVHHIFYHCDWWCLFKRTIFLACRNDLRNVRCRFIHIDGWHFSLNPILIRQLFNLKFVRAKNEDM